MNNILYYKKAADSFFKAMPLGNGRLGAMVLGEACNERILFNEDTLWSGYKRDTVHYGAKEYLPQVRELLSEGNITKAEKLIRENMLGTEFSESYLPMCELGLSFTNIEDVTDYERKLHLDKSVSEITFKSGEVIHKRKAYVSYIDDVFVYEATVENGKLNLEISLESALKNSVEIGDGEITLIGKCPDHVVPNYMPDVQNPIVYSDGKGIEFTVFLKLVTDGDVIKGSRSVKLQNADYFSVLVSSHNSFDTENHKEKSANKVISAVNRLNELYKAHCTDFYSLYKRVEIRLTREETENYDMEALISASRKGNVSNKLIEAAFQFGRYLSICSARQGQPPNLQGIWNWDLQPAWSGNWTTNINTQMNYWHTNICNLSECNNSLINWLQRIIPSGEKTAKEHYNAEGWCIHHNVDLWGMTTPVPGRLCYSFWPMAGVWFCKHIYDSWLYTNDAEYLKNTALPIIEGAVKFCLCMLVEDNNGYLVTSPSTSPESCFYSDDGKVCAVSVGTSSDMAMVKELFENYISACNSLEIESTLLSETKKALQKLRPFKYDSDGKLLEWGEDYKSVDLGHRHFSPLYGIYPSNVFLNDSKLTEASRKLFSERMANGGGRLGWSCAWATCLAARFKNRALAEELLRILVISAFEENLFSVYIRSEELPETRGSELITPDKTNEVFFQIDANFGMTTAVCELLLSQADGRVNLLPSLPQYIPDGEIRGLRIYGDFTIDILWGNSVLECVTIHCGSRCSDSTTLCYNGAVITVDCQKNKDITLHFDSVFNTFVLYAPKSKVHI